MKRAEREHLKEDPFEMFISSLLNQMKQYRKQIIIGVAAVALVFAIILAVHFISRHIDNQDNKLLNEGMEVVNSVALTPEQKIKELKTLPLGHKGKAASLILHMTNLYIHSGDLESARALLDNTPKLSLQILEDQRLLLNATLLADEGKVNEAIDQIQRLIGNPKITLNRDMLLFQLAGFQVRAGNNDAAKDNFKRLMEEFPQSMFAYRAQEALEKLN